MIPTTPMLFATPTALAEVARARAAVILIGSYDGSGNYGDLAQLDAALALLRRFEPGVLLLPVLERSRLSDHREFSEEFLNPPSRALFFDPGEGREDELLPLPAPADLAFAACYLYGGGYLNPSWGDRKMAMLHAVDDLLSTSGAPIQRLSSGLQVDAGWVAGLGAGDAEALRSFELLGVRDGASGEALAQLRPRAPILDTGDDAVGVVRRLQAAEAKGASPGKLRVNLHMAEHGWVTGRPEAMADFYGDLVAELGRCAGLPVLAQPLIAYLDRHVSESLALERLAAACAERGIELAEPRVLRPSTLTAALPEIGRAAVTLSCSYHVALTSLLLAVPAILLRDNAYYEQKAAGLAAAFDLPPSFALSSSADPRTSAGELAAVVLDEQGAGSLRDGLRLKASYARERRAGAEIELFTRLGGAAAEALGGKLDEVSMRLRERSAEPAELLARLSRLQAENGEVQAPAAAPETTEDEAARAMLAEVTGSRSWRMTEPLRRVGASLRRRG